MIVQRVLAKTDWALLREQKEWLLRMAEYVDNPEHADGLINLLDSIQDAVVEDGIRSKQIVFGGEE
jgi:hypothetical protein